MTAQVDNKPTACSFVHDLLIYLQSNRDGVAIGVISAITLDNNLFENYWSHKLSHKLDRNQSKNGMQDVHSLCPTVTKKRRILTVSSLFTQPKKFMTIVDVNSVPVFFLSRFRQNRISDQLPFDEKVLILSKRGCSLVAYL